MNDPTLIEQILFATRIVVGSVTALSILLTKREPVACLGWLLSIATFPLIGSLAYLVGGLNPYQTHTRRMRERLRRSLGVGAGISHQEKMTAIGANLDALERSKYHGFQNAQSWVAGVTATDFHRDVGIEFLINSSATYDEFERAVLAAKEYIFVQFYQILPDKVGRRFFFQLRRKAKEGVKVYVMYDAMGSYKLRRDLLDAVRSSGIQIVNFLAMHPLKRRFQINWRNHRKIIICDGEVAFVGGFNIGESYLEGDQQDTPLWRDAHFKLSGSCVDVIQKVFVGDWLFATGQTIAFKSTSVPHAKNASDNSASNFVAVVPSGPSDQRALMHSTLTAILHGAETRVWLSTAYFVPDSQILGAMRQAVERGVDVRVVIPKRSNHPITDFCTTSYFSEFLDLGLKVYLYRPGMCHAKLLLADSDLVLSGSSNLDYRSFFLNFELDLLVRDRRIAPLVEKFLTESFHQSEVLSQLHVRPGNLPLRTARNLIRLFAPIM